MTDFPSSPVSESAIEAAAQALADDVWHPPIKLQNMSSSDRNRYRRQARLALRAAGLAQTPAVTEMEFSNAFIKAGCTGMSVAHIARTILQKFDVRPKAAITDTSTLLTCKSCSGSGYINKAEGINCPDCWTPVSSPQGK